MKALFKPINTGKRKEKQSTLEEEEEDRKKIELAFKNLPKDYPKAKNSTSTRDSASNTTPSVPFSTCPRSSPSNALKGAPQADHDTVLPPIAPPCSADCSHPPVPVAARSLSPTTPATTITVDHPHTASQGKRTNAASVFYSMVADAINGVDENEEDTNTVNLSSNEFPRASDRILSPHSSSTVRHSSGNCSKEEKQKTVNSSSKRVEMGEVGKEKASPTIESKGDPSPPCSGPTEDVAPPSVTEERSTYSHSPSREGSMDYEGDKWESKLRRTAEPNPSQWEYVALYLSKTNRLRESKIRESRTKRATTAAATPAEDTTHELSMENFSDDEDLFDEDHNLILPPTYSTLGLEEKKEDDSETDESDSTKSEAGETTGKAEDVAQSGSLDLDFYQRASGTMRDSVLHQEQYYSIVHRREEEKEATEKDSIKAVSTLKTEASGEQRETLDSEVRKRNKRNAMLYEKYKEYLKKDKALHGASDNKETYPRPNPPHEVEVIRDSVTAEVRRVPSATPESPWMARVANPAAPYPPSLPPHPAYPTTTTNVRPLPVFRPLNPVPPPTPHLPSPPPYRRPHPAEVSPTTTPPPRPQYTPVVSPFPPAPSDVPGAKIDFTPRHPVPYPQPQLDGPPLPDYPQVNPDISHLVQVSFADIRWVKSPVRQKREKKKKRHSKHSHSHS